MDFFAFLSSLVSSLLRLLLWTVAGLAAAVVIAIGLVVLAAWLLVNLLLGRKPHLAMVGRFRDMQRFGAMFSHAGFKPGPIWPASAPDEPARPDVTPVAGALARRTRQTDAVLDVEARDLPADRRPS